MGCSYRAACRACGHRFNADQGGGRRFESLNCTQCASSRSLSYAEIGQPVVDLRCQLDVLDGEDEPGWAATAAYQRTVETLAGCCACGGEYRFGAPLRCPACRSTDLDLGRPYRLYD